MCAGELFFIGYQMDKKPACVWYAGLDKEGVLKFDVKVPLKVSLSPAISSWDQGTFGNYRMLSG